MGPGDEWADIALDPTGAVHNDEHTHDPARQAVAVLQAGGDASEEEDEETNKVEGVDWAVQT